MAKVLISDKLSVKAEEIFKKNNLDVTINTALSPVNELKGYPPVLFPNTPQWNIFIKVFEDREILNWIYNSSVAALCSTFISLVVFFFKSISV